MRYLSLTALLMLSACASHADGPSGGPPGGGGRGMGRLPLSPAGELIGRAAPEEAAYAATLVSWATALDTNRDGALSAEELKPDTARFFKSVDSDQDGAINTRELGEYRAAKQAMLRGGQPGEGRPNGPPPDVAPPDGSPPDAPPPPDGVRPLRSDPGAAGGRPGGGMMGGGNGEDKVMAADRNLDFRVTLAELETLAQDRLRAMDSDKDGRTSLDEIRAAGIKAFNERPARGGHGGGRPGGGGPGGGPGGGGPPGGRD